MGSLNYPISISSDHILDEKNGGQFSVQMLNVGAKGDWDFRISDLVKNPDVTDI